MGSIVYSFQELVTVREHTMIIITTIKGPNAVSKKILLQRFEFEFFLRCPLCYNNIVYYKLSSSILKRYFVFIFWRVHSHGRLVSVNRHRGTTSQGSTHPWSAAGT